MTDTPSKRVLHWEKEQIKLAAWLQSLPKPIGLLAPNNL